MKLVELKGRVAMIAENEDERQILERNFPLTHMGRKPNVCLEYEKGKVHRDLFLNIKSIIRN